MAEWIVRIVLVVAALGGAAAVATPRGRLPLALRGVRRMLRQDAGEKDSERPEGEKVPAWRKTLAFLLVLLAAAVAVLV